MHDKCCINYTDQSRENGKPWGDIGGLLGGEKGGETQINRVLAPCHMYSLRLHLQISALKKYPDIVPP